MDKQILIIDDSPTCLLIARETLRPIGDVQTVETCQSAKKLLKEKKFDVVVIDIFLPDGSGIELLPEISNYPLCQDTSFLFVTSDDDVSKKVTAFALGADDYIVKPYQPLELRARTERLLKNGQIETVYLDVETGLKLNAQSYRAFLGENDLQLTPHEFKILNLLIRHPDRIYARDQIIDLVWGASVAVCDRTVDTHVSSLRKKLKKNSQCLVSVRGEGYRWHKVQDCKIAV